MSDSLFREIEAFLERDGFPPNGLVSSDLCDLNGITYRELVNRVEQKLAQSNQELIAKWGWLLEQDADD